ncbi:MAG: lipid-binding SYLF domain-containing protein [Bryobacteraceae bacterium]
MRPLIALCLFVFPMFAAKEETVAQRLGDASDVFNEIMKAPDKSVPTDLMNRAQCIVLVPALKSAAFLVGAKYGKGFILCRRESGIGWSGPGAIRIEGGSFGLQIGGAATDIVMLVMNKQGVNAVLSSQYTMGGQAEVAAGPVGRASSAQTSGWVNAGILSYSRTRGIFAGVSLQGSTLRQDLDDNEALYGKKLDNKTIVTTRVRTPQAARKLVTDLDRYSPRLKKA